MPKKPKPKRPHTRVTRDSSPLHKLMGRAQVKHVLGLNLERRVLNQCSVALVEMLESPAFWKAVEKDLKRVPQKTIAAVKEYVRDESNAFDVRARQCVREFVHAFNKALLKASK